MHMIEFQLDECISDPAFAEKCRAMAKEKYSVEVSVLLLPRRLKGRDDDDVLEEVMLLPSPMITKDRRLVYDHTEHIPEKNPGIIVISSAPGMNRTMTVAYAGRILSEFKRMCPDWHSLPVRNSILEINQIGVLVSHVIGGVVRKDEYLTFDDPTWIGSFVDLLIQNSSA
jgi:hypothetical protein